MNISEKQLKMIRDANTRKRCQKLASLCVDRESLEKRRDRLAHKIAFIENKAKREKDSQAAKLKRLKEEKRELGYQIGVIKRKENEV